MAAWKLVWCWLLPALFMQSEGKANIERHTRSKARRGEKIIERKKNYNLNDDLASLVMILYKFQIHTFPHRRKQIRPSRRCGVRSGVLSRHSSSAKWPPLMSPLTISALSPRNPQLRMRNSCLLSDRLQKTILMFFFSSSLFCCVFTFRCHHRRELER